MRPARPALLAALAAAALVCPLVPGGAAQASTTRDLPGTVVGTAAADGPCTLSGAYLQIDAGFDYCLTLGTDRQVRVSTWEGTTNPVLDVPDLGDDTEEVAAGYRHALALDAGGDVTTWGDWGDEPYDPETGEPTGEPAPKATVSQEVQDADVAAVSAGGYHNLALTTDGAVLAWGLDADDPAVQVPAELADQVVTQISAGNGASAAITDTGHLVTWGYFADEPIPESLRDADVVKVDVGRGWAMALTSTGDLVAWGNSSENVTSIPPAVTAAGVTAFAASEDSGMAATPDGAIHYWGENNNTLGELVPPRRTGPVADLVLGRYAAAAVYAQLAPSQAPRITGTPARVGRTLAGVEPTSWSETPGSVAYQWRRNGTAITGATETTYKLTPADAGRRISFAVTATGPQGYDDTTVVSAATSAVALAPARLRVTAPTAVVRSRRASVSASGLAAGERFTVTLDGRRVGTGSAGPSGVARLTFTVPATTRLGARPVVVTGSLADRTGRATTTVRRG